MRPVVIIVGLITAIAAAAAIANLMGPKQEWKVRQDEGLEKIEELAISPTGPYPKAVVDEYTYDFGQMVLGSTQRHTFSIRNEGEAPLKLVKGQSTCKCTLSDLAKSEIEPGESVEVDLEWEPKSAKLNFLQSATIFTNDPERRKVIFSIMGEVHSLIRTMPSEKLSIGTIAEDEPTEFAASVYSTIVDDFEIVDLVKSGENFTAEVTPLTDEEKSEIAQQVATSTTEPSADGSQDTAGADVKVVGYRITGKVDPQGGAGPFVYRIEAHTNIKPDLSMEKVNDGGVTVKWDVTGSRAGPVTIFHRDWIGSQMLMMLDKFPASEGRKVTATMFIKPGNEPLTFEPVSSNPDFLKLTLTPEKTSVSKGREKYKLTFEVPPGHDPSYFSSDKPATITVKTNREDLGTMTFNVEFEST